MPTFTISVVNETFASSNQHEMTTLDNATAQALQAALQIGAEEIVAGKPFFAAEVKVESANQVVGRFMVSVGSSRLMITG